MKCPQQKRFLSMFMAAVTIWLSLWAPVCLAMGTIQTPVSMGCTCPMDGQHGGLVAGCAQVDGVTTYLDVSPVSAHAPVFHVLPAAPIELPKPTARDVYAVPYIDFSPPPTHRPLNLQYCVFLN